MSNNTALILIGVPVFAALIVIIKSYWFQALAFAFVVLFISLCVGLGALFINWVAL